MPNSTHIVHHSSIQTDSVVVKEICSTETRQYTDMRDNRIWVNKAQPTSYKCKREILQETISIHHFLTLSKD